jgi:uncharacterized protein DUF6893
MTKKVFGTALVLLAAYVVVTSLPDVARYIKIRQM